MKIAPGQAERFVQAPDPGLRAVLLYGPDGGLVRERALALVTVVAGDPKDPFRVAELSGSQVNDDPARLADELAAQALTGGRRCVRLRDPAETQAKLIGDLLTLDSQSDTLLVLEAGDLPPRSALRKLFEGAKQGAALACYRDDERSLPALIAETLGAAGLTLAPDARAYLAARLGGDRQLTRRELDKLVLYMGQAGGRVELDDAIACIGDSAALSLDDLTLAVADGDLVGLERNLARSLQEGATPVGVLRAVARHVERLHFVVGMIAGGSAPDEAVKRLRPPVFWKQAARFRAQAQAWPPADLARALDRLIAAESDCKRSGAADQAIAAQTLLALCARAPGRRSGRAGSVSR